MRDTTPYVEPAALPRFLAVIPALDEEHNIGAVLDELAGLGPSCVPLVIDDGSTDATAAVARTRGVRTVRLARNIGIGGAVQTGFMLAEREGFEFLVQVDADGQHDPAQITRILTPVVSGDANVAIGSRWQAGEAIDGGIHRRMLLRTFAIVVSLATGQRLTDTSSSFRAYDRRAIRLCAATYPHGFLETIEATVLLKRSGISIAEVPVVIRARSSGQSSLSLFRAFAYSVKVLLAIIASLTQRAPKAG
jgi:glycosyltransferase involved in cell wall biosynthesis